MEEAQIEGKRENTTRGMIARVLQLTSKRGSTHSNADPSGCDRRNITTSATNAISHKMQKCSTPRDANDRRLGPLVPRKFF